MKTSRLDRHADDFGLTLQTTIDITDCIICDKLDSISVVPNMKQLSQCTAYWNEIQEKRRAQGKAVLSPAISVHLNFVDGCSLEKTENVRLLVNDKGEFITTWGSLFKSSFLYHKKRKAIKMQLKREIVSQIERIKELFPNQKQLRIDSHQHTHMIPIVAESLIEVIDEQEYQVEFVRVSREPLMPFLKTFSLYPTFKPINLVKNIILNLLAFQLEKKLKKRNISYYLLWGLLMSGHMDEMRITKIMPVMFAYLERKGKKLELLFHPGTATKEEIQEEYMNPDAISFYLGEGRKIEYHGVMNLECSSLK
ncbi:MAG: ChbG/HpnK family deacetylase [Eubacteriales bacterium]